MAYALENTVQILAQDQHHLLLACKPQIKSFLEKARQLIDLYFTKSSDTHPKIRRDLDSRIRDVAHKAEDLIESHIRDQLLSDAAIPSSDLDLTCILEEFDSIRNEIQSTHPPQEHASSKPAAAAAAVLSGPGSLSDPGFKSNMVGFSEDLDDLLGQLLAGRDDFLLRDMALTADKRDLCIVAIVGMVGIGKTFLARQLYHHPGVVNHFDCRTWVTISKEETSVRVILLAILCGLRHDLNTEMMRDWDKWKLGDEWKLGEELYKSLIGRRYLIVIDDIWDTNTWDNLRRFFPSNSNRSRIVLTTRLATVASISSRPYQMRLMNADESWELLCSEVFGQVSCPPELVNIGKKIANRCQGLPLAIISIAPLLLSNKKVDYWEYVAMTVSSRGILLDSDLQTVSRSYNHLPCHLKPCFLYIGLFPEDCAIQVTKIVKLWMAEGFVKQTKSENLEDTAEAYLQALVDANVLLVCDKEPNGKVSTFKIHFLLGEICKEKAFEEKFSLFKNLGEHDIPKGGDHLRRVGVHPLDQPSSKMKLTPLVRSFLCVGPASRQLAPLFLGSTLLRVLDVFQLEFFHFPTELLQLVHLRFLALSCHSDIPSSICRLKNLQTLIIRRLPSFRAFSLPSEFWELSQLRHIKCTETCIWYFPEDGVCTPQENLQTLSNIQMFVVTDEFLGNIPNLRKLGLFCNKAVHSVIHLDRLSKLEKLKCSSNLSHATNNFLSYLTLPPSLTKLTLSFCKIPSGFMEYVGQLPNLEQLKLQKCSFPKIWPIWELVDEQFNQLRFLQMEGLNLVRWMVSYPGLPRLQHLIIRGCCSMMEIPTDIGLIFTLKLIEVDEYCSHSVIASAKEIYKEQKEVFGNDLLQVHVGSTRGTSHPREYQEPIRLNKHTFEQKQDMEAKRKSYVKKLKERINLN